MAGRTLVEIRDLAKQMAQRRGHQIRRWNRKRLRYTASCSKCYASLRVYAHADEEPGRREVLDPNGEILVSRASERYWTERDFYLAEGTALTSSCYK